MPESIVNDDVLFVLKLPPPFGGGEIAHQYIYEELRGRYRILVFTRAAHNKAVQGKIKLANILFGLKMALKVAAACLKKRPKVVFLWLPKDLPAFLRTAAVVSFLRALEVKVIGDLHGMGFSFLSRPKLKNFYEKQINKFFAIRTRSLSISNDLRSSGFNNIIAPVDNGVKAPNFVLRTMPTLTRPVRLLYLGAISEAKGFMRVLQLLLLLHENNIPFLLEVVGEWADPDFRNDAMEVISQNDLSPFVDFAGILIDEAKWRAIQRSHFLLHFTRWDGQPLTIIEAMAAGVPSIAHKVGAIPEMITDHKDGFLVDDPRQAFEIIGRAMDDRIDYRRISLAARRTFEKRFTIQRYIENSEKLIMVNEHVASDAISENG